MTAALLRRALVGAALAGFVAGAAAETTVRQVRVGGVERSYEIDVPAPATPGRALPAVIVFHGGGGNAESVRKQSGLSARGAAEGFAVVYPQGSGGVGGKLRTWNGGTCCGWAQRHGVDETAFIAAVLDDLAAAAPIDRSRVYATGISNGGMLAYKTACAFADRIAAIAVVAGEMTSGDDCRPARPVPVLVIHGTADRNLPFDGGRGERALGGVREVRSVASAIDFWRRHDGCSGTAASEQSSAVRRMRHAPCQGGSEVELIAIEGGGHSWPGGDRIARFLDPPSPALDASDEIWRFFARHRR